MWRLTPKEFTYWYLKDNKYQATKVVLKIQENGKYGEETRP